MATLLSIVGYMGTEKGEGGIILENAGVSLPPFLFAGVGFPSFLFTLIPPPRKKAAYIPLPKVTAAVRRDRPH